ncbi:MAG: DarT ssDNA thymidine ADP-ribosyltransferase family protein, partial [Thermomicrobiales bacterium]
MTVRRSDVIELHFFSPRANLDSIRVHGILSHARAAVLPHVSIANESVQHYLRNKRLPSGRMLHEYANLYFHARNPMMYFKKDD